MKKFIVTTSIYEPSEATIKFSQMSDWILIVVGDKKTPHESYKNLPNCLYLSPEFQEQNYKELSDAIGWNCIMRRNIGFIEAYKRGADVVASIDDDNIPYDEWGKDLLVDEKIYSIDTYETHYGVFDPMRVTNHPELWHRGYPLNLINNPIQLIGKVAKKVDIQASLWDGDPDVDAICRMIHNPKGLKLTSPDFYSTNDLTPFNSQNTFISRYALPYYMVLPGVGRMDDIWGGYICEHLLNIRPVFSKATVYQQRNEQSLKKNFLDEVIGHTTTLEFLADIDNWRNYLPEQTLKAFDLYRSEYGKLRN